MVAESPGGLSPRGVRLLAAEDGCAPARVRQERRHLEGRLGHGRGRGQGQRAGEGGEAGEATKQARAKTRYTLEACVRAECERAQPCVCVCGVHGQGAREK